MWLSERWASCGPHRRGCCGYGSDFEYADRDAADADHTHADTTKAGELMGDDPQHTIREGVSKFIDWYRANQNWYEPLVQSS